jgi:hypothetical protein
MRERVAKERHAAQDHVCADNCADNANEDCGSHTA